MPYFIATLHTHKLFSALKMHLRFVQGQKGKEGKAVQIPVDVLTGCWLYGTVILQVLGIDNTCKASVSTSFIICLALGST